MTRDQLKNNIGDYIAAPAIGVTNANVVRAIMRDVDALIAEKIKQTTPTLERLSVTEPHEFLLFCSYCDDDDPECSSKRPCNECLSMSNVFAEDGTYVREMGPPKTGYKP